ncbi:DNA-binding response regulator [Nocardioides sp. LHG3406-4]|uniref:DNA-binding response regulator n=1 Tax=Nocardioides sp. LHG3406-4 TaxID=2804575 RepID=UPI003CEF5697
MPMRPVAAALGLPPEVDRLYRQVYAGSGTRVDEVAQSLLRTREQLLAELGPMISSGVVRLEDDVLHVASPAESLGLMLAAESRKADEVAQRLAGLSRALPFLGEGDSRVEDVHALAIDGERLSSDRSVPQTLVSWIEETSGEVLFLRPDQWRMPSESMMFQATMTAVRAGRVVRAIYPARALQEAPDVLVSRARSGEQIRVVPEVHTRLAIVGTNRAMLPDPPGVANAHRLVIRQRGLIEMLVAYFDALWDTAAAVPHLDSGDARPDLRRLLLTQLAAGAKDEQISRTLGMSLRTVRRRIHTLMSDLGVDTRFAAGVEAVRRGWI